MLHVSFICLLELGRRSCREQVAHEKHARELDEFSQALNGAADWKCRRKPKQDRSEEPECRSNSKRNGLGSHFVPGTGPAKQQKTKSCASVVYKSGRIVRQRAPTTKKRPSRVAGEERAKHITRAQAGQGKQNKWHILARLVTVRQPQSRPDNEPHGKKEAKSDNVRLRGTSFSKLADGVREMTISGPKRRKVERAKQHHGSRCRDERRGKGLAV